MRTRQPLKICFALPYYDAQFTDPAAFLDEVPLMRYLPRALSERGHEVHVAMLFPVSDRFTEHSVHYHLTATPRVWRSALHTLARPIGCDPVLLEPALALRRRIRQLQPDCIHFHGIILAINLALILRAGGRTAIPVVLHYHGGYPSSRRAVRFLQRKNFARVKRFLFTTPVHAHSFVEAGLIADPAHILAIMETSTPFTYHPRSAAREATAMQGDPVCLWTGRLHPDKDPLTALRAFALILATRPDAQFYLYFRTSELLSELKTYVAAHPQLIPRVHFRGSIPLSQMEAVYNSADFLLQCSRREFSGYAVLEAMACGVIPVVTDIPSFRTMTHGGRYGRLFPVGQPEALAQRLLSFSREEIPQHAERVRAWFEQALSFDALAEQLETVYQQVLSDA